MNLLPFLLDAVRGAVILGIALAALPLLRRAPPSIRRALLMVALFSALLAPLLARAFAASSAAPAMTLPFFIREIHVDAAAEPSQSPPPVIDSTAVPAGGESIAFTVRRAPVVVWSTLLLSLWALGAFGVVVRLGLGIRRARVLLGRARRDALPGFLAVTRAVAQETGVRAEVAISDDIDAPAVAGVFRHTVLMPASALAWSQERWRVVLLHEFAHAARYDCLVSVIVELACAMHWFDPLAWLARHRLRRERELAADEKVLAAGTLASDYAAHLLAIASASPAAHVAGALGMTAKPSELAGRIEALVKHDGSAPVSPALLPSIVIAASAMALAVACANPRPAPQPLDQKEARGEPTPAPARLTPLGEEGTEAPVPARADAVSLVEQVAEQINVPASRITLSIEPALQSIVDDELAELVAAHRPAAATAVVLDPMKGELLAIGDAGTARRAFVTGSTIKPVTLAAALEGGAVRLEQKFDCRARSIGAHRIYDGKERGLLDVAAIIEVSSNVGASRIFDAMKREGFDDALGRLHLGEASTVQLSNVARGDVPKTVQLDAGDAALVAIGGGLTATPLQMASVYGVFANGGEYVAPTLVRRVVDDRGRALPPRAAPRERVMRAETAHTVMQLLERVVQGDHGTGKGARVQGVRVAGKTGTGGYTTPDGKDHVYSSFIGVVPADAPRFVILVGAADPREGASGAVVAAPAFAKIAARALGGR